MGETACSLVKDAVTEMKEGREEWKQTNQEEGGSLDEDDPRWTNDEFEITMHALNLMKVKILKVNISAQSGIYQLILQSICISWFSLRLILDHYELEDSH